MKKIMFALVFVIILLSMVSAYTMESSLTNWTNFTTQSSTSQSFSGVQFTVIGSGISFNTVNVSSINNATSAYLVNASSSVVLNSAYNRTGNLFVFPKNINLNTSASYWIQFDANGSNFNYATEPVAGSFYPVLSNGINYTGRNTDNNPTILNGLFSIGNLTNPILAGAISVALNSPEDNTQTNLNLTSFNATETPSTFSLVNATLYTWFNNGTLFNTSTQTITGSVANATNWSLNLPIYNNYLWNVLGVQGNANGTNSSYALNNNTLVFTPLITQGITFNPFTYETASETFYANISSISIPTNAFLIYNSSTYPASIINIAGNYYNLSSTIDIQPGVTNNTFYFNTSIRGFTTTTNSSSQGVYNASLLMTSSAACNSGWLPYLNLTFQDEINSTMLNGTMGTANVTYWLGTGTQTKNLLTSNSSGNQFYQLCFAPQNRTIITNYNFEYGATGYPGRNIVSTNVPLTSSITNNVLYLLQQSQGQIVTFQMVNSATQPISGVYGTASRVINGVSTVIGSGISGNDGGIAFFLNPLSQYSFSFSLAGYTTFTETIFPTQSGYTVTLSSTAGGGANDYTRGITQTIQPTIGELTNGTYYLFNYSVGSTYWTLQNFSFSLYGNNGTLIGTQSSTTPGTLTLNASTSNYTSLTMYYYYGINGTITNSSVTWIISNPGSYGILTLFTDFKNYLIGGLFGANAFAVALIIYLVIFISTGLIAWKVGYTAPGTVIAVFTGLVIIFDVALGFDSVMNPANAVPYFPSIFMLILAIAGILRDNQR